MKAKFIVIPKKHFTWLEKTSVEVEWSGKELDLKQVDSIVLQNVCKKVDDVVIFTDCSIRS